MTDVIQKTIEIKAPVEKVWKALTDHDQFGQWFRVKLDAPFAPSEDSTGHMTYPGYEHLAWKARVVEMQEPSLFSFTWHPYAIDPKVDYSGEEPTLVEFRLEPTAEGVRLIVTESGFDRVPAYRREEAMRMNDGGWAQQVENIKAYVER